MIFKIFIVLLAGLLEQIFSTIYLLSVEKRQSLLSSIWMVLCMFLNLFIIAYAIKDSDTWLLLLIYVMICGWGNFLVIKWERRVSREIRKLRRKLWQRRKVTLKLILKGLRKWFRRQLRRYKKYRAANAVVIPKPINGVEKHTEGVGHD